MLALLLSFALTADRPVVVLLPLNGTADLQEPAYAASLRMQEALERTPLLLMHPKHVYAVADAARIGDELFGKADTAKRLGERLGATHVLYGELTRSGQNVELALSLDVAGKLQATKKLAVPSSDQQALFDKAPALLVETLGAALDAPASEAVKSMPSQPARAYLDYALCHKALAKQAVSLRSPVFLDAESRVAAVKRCTAATQAAPQMKQAFAALGFARALVSEREEAEAALEKAKAQEGLMPYYVIGKFWLLSRFYDQTTAINFMRETAAKFPGFLLGRGYLGEALNVAKRYDEALAVFTAYAADVPKLAWVRAQVGYTEAKRGNHPKAIEETRAAVALAPDDGDIKLELASRLIDAGNVADALKMLEDLTKEPPAKGELLLRLGYAHLLQDHTDEAEKWIKNALERAKGPREWRTRGRARYDLARVLARRGDKKAAVDELERAWGEGYKDAAKLASEKDFEPLRSDPRFQALGQKPKPGQLKLPVFTSPFAHDPLTGGDAPLASASQSKPELQKKAVEVRF